MRRIVLCAALALASLASAVTAFGDDSGPTTVAIDSHITPVIRAFTPKTSAASLAVNLKFSGPNGTQADTLTGLVLKFSYGAHLNGKFFPSCSADTIRNHKACPRGSLIGTGTGLGVVGGDTSNPTKEPITLKLYNNNKGNGITFLIQGDNPVPIDVPFDAPLKTLSGGTYNYVLTVNVPSILQQVAGLPISIDFLNVKVGATTKHKGKKVGYIETLICPPGALVPLQGDFSFINSQPFHTDTFIHCG
jgi:hypothetical protein